MGKPTPASPLALKGKYAVGAVWDKYGFAPPTQPHLPRVIRTEVFAALSLIETNFQTSNQTSEHFFLLSYRNQPVIPGHVTCVTGVLVKIKIISDSSLSYTQTKTFMGPSPGSLRSWFQSEEPEPHSTTNATPSRELEFSRSTQSDSGLHQ